MASGVLRVDGYALGVTLRRVAGRVDQYDGWGNAFFQLFDLEATSLRFYFRLYHGYLLPTTNVGKE
jgi:hypothetical protein